MSGLHGVGEERGGRAVHAEDPVKYKGITNEGYLNPQ